MERIPRGQVRSVMLSKNGKIDIYGFHANTTRKRLENYIVGAGSESIDFSYAPYEVKKIELGEKLLVVALAPDEKLFYAGGY